MALPKSNIIVPRKKIAGMEAAWAKMWDPPRASPATPDRLVPDNPVPGFMQSLGLGVVSQPNTVTRQLLHGLVLTTWDGAVDMDFMAFRDPDFANAAIFPGATIRVPRGTIFHCETHGSGPPPHTIHWHGLEPTPMNDGVGHCSMEIGDYTYQFQPNFIGTYFYHCHRNTVQHFEFGLYGMFLVEPPDAYSTEFGMNPGGYPRRTAANLSGAQFAHIPGFVSGDATFGVGNATDDGVGHPHAFTVPYDVECLWVADDRDSNWSELAGNAKSFYPGGPNAQDGVPGAIGGTRPGVDDIFAKGFFDDYRADYWYVTGVPVPAHPVSAGGEGIATIDPSLVPPGVLDTDGSILPIHNSGVAGMRVDVLAEVNQTVLVRVLNGAYNTIKVTFPIDVVVIAYDGRALGVPPYGRYNKPFILRANEEHVLSTARRFDALIRSAEPFEGFATIEFLEASGFGMVEDELIELVTARIPINITPAT